jgi:phage host-nuclease inhibitor protein Gam
MSTLTDLDRCARLYADARDNLSGIVTDLTAGIEALKRRAMPDLKRAVARAAEHHDALLSLIADAPELFVKPKTLTLHGIRLGYVKQKGSIAWDDADAVVAAIQKYLPEQAEALIRWTAKPLKEALNQLGVADLKRIGCRVIDTGEAVVIKPVDSEVDRLVDALLRDATATEEAAQ